MKNAINDQRRERAKALFSQGNISEALLLLKENINNIPSDIDSIYISGICYAASENYSAAEKYFNKAAKINPSLFHIYNDLALSQFYQGKQRDAIKSLNKALKLSPDFGPALSGMALVYMQINEPIKGLHYINKAISAGEVNQRSLNIQALCYRATGKSDVAISIFKNIILKYPGFYDAYHNLHETYVNIADYDNAEMVLHNAKKLFKGNPSLYATLGKFYEINNHISEAQETYTEGIRTTGESKELLTALARTNISLKNFDEGYRILIRALEIDSTFQPAIIELCNLHILKSEYQKARSVTEEIMNTYINSCIMPGLSIAHANACMLCNSPSESIESLKNVIKLPLISDDAKEAALFSMADAHEKLKNYGQAFKFYTKANSIRTKISDIDYYIQALEDIRNAISKDYLSSIPRSNQTSDKPVFIVGMPRSGTSLIEQIISSHSMAHGAGEINNLWSIANDISGSMNLLNYTKKLKRLNQADVNNYANNYIAYIEGLNKDALRITDKLPHNFMHIGLIEILFPCAKVIHCTRHPFDTCLSIYFKKFNNNHAYARKLDELATFYKQYQELMTHWENTSGLKILHVPYENLISNQEAVSRDIIKYIGLDWEENCLSYYKSDRAIMTPSYAQANKPIYKDSMYRWRNYVDFLDPLISVLGDPEQYIKQPK